MRHNLQQQAGANLVDSGQTVLKHCPHCGKKEILHILYSIDSMDSSDKGFATYLCVCGRLSITIGLIERVGGFFVIVPFMLMGLGGLIIAVYLIGEMIFNLAFHGVFLVLAVFLGAGAILVLKKTVPTVLRIFTPGALLPLGIDDDGVHRFESDL